MAMALACSLLAKVARGRPSSSQALSSVGGMLRRNSAADPSGKRLLCDAKGRRHFSTGDDVPKSEFEVQPVINAAAFFCALLYMANVGPSIYTGIKGAYGDEKIRMVSCDDKDDHV